MSRRKSPSKSDPFAEREAEKYAKPIPSREFIMEYLANAGNTMTLNMIANVFKLTSEEDLEALRRRLRAMERDGQVIRNRRKGYGLAKKMDLVRGRVIAHPDGFGFLVTDDDSSDLFLSEKQMHSLLHGDRALVNIVGIDHRGRREGALVEVLERNTVEVVGRFFRKKGIGMVEANNRRIHQKILIIPDESKQAKEGQIVVVRLVEQPTKHDPPMGQIIEIMGEEAAPGMEIDIAVRSHGLPSTLSEEVLAETAKLPDEVLESAIKGRLDLRHLPFVTIDGEDARDFDDAVYCEPRGKGWLLYVAIADVSAYVKPNTALDLEAKNRGNSVYFPSRVIPMLPEKLSNGLCSLNPQVNRLCIVCELNIDFYGRTRRTQFFEGVIYSAARLTYTEVAQVIEGKTKNFKSPSLLPHIKHLHQLYQVLRKRRNKRGAIDFDTTETQILFDEQRKIHKIIPLHRNEAHKLIEEMMLAANVATASWLGEHDMPVLYRNHEGPVAEKLAELRTFLAEFGLRLGGKDKPTAMHYAKLIEKASQRPDKRLIQTVLLRSMQMAVYSPKNKGHFGLSFDEYAHFTSPIRRYPDLMVHRAIRHCLAGKPADKFPYSDNEMHLLAENCSMTERRADEATRDAITWLKCEYMQDKVGEVYNGLVTGVTSFGIFIELDGIFVEGLVHVTALRNDYYHFDPIRHRLFGEYSGTIYRLADQVRVRVIRVDLEERKIDFELA